MNIYLKSTIVITFFFLVSCAKGQSAKTEKEVPTTLEQHSSSVSSSNSNAKTSSSNSSSSSSSSSATSGGPTSFSFSTSGNNQDVTDLTNIRDIAENKEVREYLQKEAVKLMLADKLIASKDASVSLVITNELVMVNKKVLDRKDAEKYRDLLKSKLSMGDVFNYSFRQN